MFTINPHEINELRSQNPEFNLAMEKIEQCQHEYAVSHLLNDIATKGFSKTAVLAIIASIPKHISRFPVPCSLLNVLSNEQYQAVFEALPAHITEVDFSQTLAMHNLRAWPVFAGAISRLHEGVISLNFRQSFIDQEDNFEQVRTFLSQLPAHISELDISYINVGKLAKNFDTAALLVSLPVSIKSLTLSFDQCLNMRREYEYRPNFNDVIAVLQSVPMTIRDLKVVGFSVRDFDVEPLRAVLAALPASCHTLVFSQIGSFFRPRPENRRLTDFDVFLQAADALPPTVRYFDFSSGISLEEVSVEQLLNSEGKFPHVKRLALRESEFVLLPPDRFSRFMSMFPNLVIFERGTLMLAEPEWYQNWLPAITQISNTTGPKIFSQYAIQYVIWISFIDCGLLPTLGVSKRSMFLESFVENVVLNNLLTPYVSKTEILLGFEEHPIYINGVYNHPIYTKISEISDLALREKVAFTLMQYLHDSNQYHLYPDEREVIVMLDRIISSWQRRDSETLAASSSNGVKSGVK